MTMRAEKRAREEAEKASCRATIYAVPEDRYGHAYRQHYLEQYRLFIESVNHTSDIKLKVHTFFLTVNTALMTAIGVGFSGKAELGGQVWHLLLPLAGMFMSFIWFGIVYSYKERNVIKLRIIHCLEEQLPLALYRTEWHQMEENHSSPLKRFLFRIDLFIPLVFFLSYLVFALVG